MLLGTFYPGRYYPDTATLAFGVHLDDNEEFKMTGTIESVQIFGGTDDHSNYMGLMKTLRWTDRALVAADTEADASTNTEADAAGRSLGYDAAADGPSADAAADGPSSGRNVWRPRPVPVRKS